MTGQRKPRLPHTQLARLEEALEMLTLQRCGVAIEHKNALRSYLDTWVGDPLRRVVEWARNEEAQP